MKSNQMNFIPEDSTSQFKVPISKKRSAFRVVGSSGESLKGKSRFHKSQEALDYQRLRLWKLIFKMTESPSSLTKSEKVMLMGHPIIKDLIKYSKDNNWGSGNFYIPLESLLSWIFKDDAALLNNKSDSSVEVIFEELREQKSKN